MSSLTFKEKLAMGRTGESMAAKWLQSKGCQVLPMYETKETVCQGPVLFTTEGHDVVAPDLIAFSKQRIVWVEVKYKSASPWNRKRQMFTTGIDKRYYHEYIKVSQLTTCPVWLLFLIGDGVAKDSPKGPSGLFASSLKNLIEKKDHESKRWGPSGMVYWNMKSLIKLADYPLTL